MTRKTLILIARSRLDFQILFILLPTPFLILKTVFRVFNVQTKIFILEDVIRKSFNFDVVANVNWNTLGFSFIQMESSKVCC